MMIYTSFPEMDGATIWNDKFNAIQPHLHNNLELNYTVEGTRTVVVNGQTYSVEAGGMLIIFPFQLHEYPNSGEGHGYSFFLHPMMTHKLSNILMNSYPESPYIAPDRMPPRIKSIIDLLISTPEHSQYGNIIDALCVALVTEIIVSVPLVSGRMIPKSDAERILTTCMDHYADSTFSLNALIDIVGISRRSISRFFNERMHISFPKFMAQLRLNQSIKLLREGHTILDAAMRCGFGSIRSFNRVFSEEYGMPPRDYIRRTDK